MMNKKHTSPKPSTPHRLAVPCCDLLSIWLSNAIRFSLRNIKMPLTLWALDKRIIWNGLLQNMCFSIRKTCGANPVAWCVRISRRSYEVVSHDTCPESVQFIISFLLRPILILNNFCTKFALLLGCIIQSLLCCKYSPLPAAQLAGVCSWPRPGGGLLSFSQRFNTCARLLPV